MNRRALLVLVLTGCAWRVYSAPVSWPGFRGPNSSGVGAHCSPPTKIGTNDAVLWKVSVPWSPSSPCVLGDNIFLTTFADNELQTRCYQRGDGQLLWSRGVKAENLETFHSTESSPAASTPATDGERVVSYFGSFGLVCYDLRGKELWRHALPTALSLGGYGTATCPLIAGNLVVIIRDRDDASSLLAVDLRTGEKVWETSRPDSYGTFGTPIIWQNNDVAEIVVPGPLRLKGYALDTGKEDWDYEGTTAFVCTTPITADGLLFFAAWSDGKADEPLPTWEKFLADHDKNKDGVVSLDEFDEGSRDYYRGYDVNHDGKIERTDWDKIEFNVTKGENVALAIKPGGRGNITSTHVLWKATKGLPYVASPVCYEGRLYMVKNGGMLSCLDSATGKPFYQQERIGADGNYYASPVIADGRIYLASVSGKVTVVQTGGNKPVVLHQTDFPERIYATPALAEKNLYLRSRSTLYAFGH